METFSLKRRWYNRFHWSQKSSAQKNLWNHASQSDIAGSCTVVPCSTLMSIRWPLPWCPYQSFRTPNAALQSAHNLSNNDNFDYKFLSVYGGTSYHRLLLAWILVPASFKLTLWLPCPAQQLHLPQDALYNDSNLPHDDNNTGPNHYTNNNTT